MAEQTEDVLDARDLSPEEDEAFTTANFIESLSHNDTEAVLEALSKYEYLANKRFFFKNETDPVKSRTPLYVAILYKNPRLVEKLLTCGADINAPVIGHTLNRSENWTIFYHTPLAQAIRLLHGSPEKEKAQWYEIIEILLGYQDKINWSQNVGSVQQSSNYGWTMVMCGGPELLQFVFERINPENKNIVLNHKGAMELTLLDNAVQHADTLLFQTLLHFNAKFTSSSDQNTGTLMLAMKYNLFPKENAVKKCQRLLEMGAYLTLNDFKTMCNVDFSDFECNELYGGDNIEKQVYWQNRMCLTMFCLFKAVTYVQPEDERYPEVVEVIKRSKFQGLHLPSIARMYDKTEFRSEMVEELLTPKDCKTKSFLKLTPLMIAVLGNDKDMVDILLKSGYDVGLNDVAQDGCTALHYAAYSLKLHENQDIILALLSQEEIDPLIRDKRGYSPNQAIPDDFTDVHQIFDKVRLRVVMERVRSRRRAQNPEEPTSPGDDVAEVNRSIEQAQPALATSTQKSEAAKQDVAEAELQIPSVSPIEPVTPKVVEDAEAQTEGLSLDTYYNCVGLGFGFKAPRYRKIDDGNQSFVGKNPENIIVFDQIENGTIVGGTWKINDDEQRFSITKNDENTYKIDRNGEIFPQVTFYHRGEDPKLNTLIAASFKTFPQSPGRKKGKHIRYANDGTTEVTYSVCFWMKSSGDPPSPPTEFFELGMNGSQLKDGLRSFNIKFDEDNRGFQDQKLWDLLANVKNLTQAPISNFTTPGNETTFSEVVEGTFEKGVLNSYKLKLNQHDRLMVLELESNEFVVWALLKHFVDDRSKTKLFAAQGIVDELWPLVKKQARTNTLKFESAFTSLAEESFD